MDLDVVVCAKNRAAMLERILEQITHEVPLRDLIVVYGSSKDGTKEVAERYTRNVFWDEDKGLGSARNLGMRKASSELVAMIDTDVVLTEDWCKRLVKHFEDGKVAAAMGVPIYGYGSRPVQRLFEYWRWYNTESWGCSNTIFRRKLVLKVGNFDEEIRGAGEDYDLRKRLKIAGYRYIWDRKVVVYHPMNLFELLNHISWWSKGAPFIRELISEVRTYSLFRIYARFAFQILDSLREGVRLAFVVHPSTLFLLPMINTVSVASRFKELKKTLSASPCP